MRNAALAQTLGGWERQKRMLRTQTKNIGVPQEIIMKLFTTVAAAAMLLVSANAAFAARAYVGTYTADPTDPKSGQSSHGEGIYLVDVDGATGALSNPKLMAKMLSPSWITLSADHKFLYAVSEVASYGADKHGSVTAFAVDGATGALKKLNTVDSGGAVPCFVSTNGKFVMVANYFGGTYEVIRLKPDGSLGDITDVVKPGGPLNPSTASDTQPGQYAGSSHEGSRAHMIAPGPDGYIVGDDAGRDQIFVWKLDDASGKLKEVSVTKALPGSAPRHFVFSHDGKTMYQLQEQDSRLQVHDFKDGKLTPRGASVSALPFGYQGSNTGSELRIDAAGKHLYSGNRTYDSIATFNIGADGVTLAGNVHTEGNNPRSLTLDPTGKFLYSLNQGANNVVTFRIQSNGIPKATGAYVAIGTPAVMVFLP
jgi:6-phosphogluconolactonase